MPYNCPSVKLAASKNGLSTQEIKDISMLVPHVLQLLTKLVASRDALLSQRIEDNQKPHLILDYFVDDFEF